MNGYLRTNTSYWRYCLLGTLLLSVNTITLSAQPSDQPALDFYLPFKSSSSYFTSQLSSALNDAGLNNVALKNIQQWQSYQQSVRHGREGIYLSPPHFSAWLQHKHGFVPVLKLSGTLSYVIASHTKHTNIFEIRDLINKKICSRPPLNLDYLLITQAFAKNVQSAEVHTLSSVINELNNPQSPCFAFSISEYQFQALETKHPSKYIRLSQSPRYSNYAVFASPSVSKETLTKLKNILRLTTVRSLFEPFLDDISSDQTFIKVQDGDYPEQDAELLSDYWSR